jgi:hypothetical protein
MLGGLDFPEGLSLVSWNRGRGVLHSQGAVLLLARPPVLATTAVQDTVCAGCEDGSTSFECNRSQIIGPVIGLLLTVASWLTFRMLKRCTWRHNWVRERMMLMQSHSAMLRTSTVCCVSFDSTLGCTS